MNNRLPAAIRGLDMSVATTHAPIAVATAADAPGLNPTIDPAR
jgi:hypothetical protein